ncbi:leucine-rich repeat protein, putative [Plasmodium malariae]|uniref:Leucine-rich repeat protein, putative n=1 Tax=Plasmodium malariae TaxID=5858 RepID=A0A1C3KC37_PLAMA|nr:leucine-rich repeat protein, putative [Plasmodium malariae]
MNEEKENNKKDERQNYTDDINCNEEYGQQNEKKEDVNDSTFEDIIPEEDYKRIRTNIINESILINEINKYNSAKGEDSTDKLIHTKILSLENRKILIIQNMNLFKSLEELHLDNNLIEELENLDELVNLKILSVSNNKIKEIKNLKNLKNLEELNLHNNRIKKIENLNNNKKLKILILSKNYIEDIENIIYLRCLKELKFLNLEDNPICNVDNVDNVNNINNVTNEVKCKLKSIKYFNNEILASYQKKKDQTHVNTTTMCATRNNEFEFGSLNSAIDNKEIYEKKILEAFLYDITVLAKSLFEDTKEPVVLIHYNVYRAPFPPLSAPHRDQVLLLNEERKKCSEIFEDDVENFISAYMLNNVKEYNTLRKRAKKVIHSLLSFLNCKQDEINEYYSYKGNRSNILNNLEDFISSSYNKSCTFLIEEKKKYLFLKSRDRITEIGKIVDTFNDLFYSYLSTLRVK